jgi:hypothetical protein
MATGLGSGAEMNENLPLFRPGPGRPMAYHALPRALHAGSWARFDGVDFGEHRSAPVSVVARARSVGCPFGEAFPAPSFAPCDLSPPSCLLGARVRFQIDGPEQETGRTLATFDIPTHPGSSSEFALISGRMGDAVTPRVPVPVFMVFEALAATCKSSKAGGVVDWFRFVTSNTTTF